MQLSIETQPSGRPRRGRPRERKAILLYRRAAELAAADCHVDLLDVLSARRRKGAVAEAREIAAYLAVTGFNLSRKQVSRLTGRHRSAIQRYCMVIEARRDEQTFDDRISALEARLL